MKKNIDLSNEKFISFKKNLRLTKKEFYNLVEIKNDSELSLIPLFRFNNQTTKEEIIVKITNVSEFISFKTQKLNIKDFDTFVFDMDGTLLDSKKNIVPNNLNKLNELRALGKNICIATGRAIFMLENYLKLIPYNLPFLCANGGMVYNHKTMKLISNFNIKDHDAKLLMDKCEELNLGYYVFWNNGLVGVNVENSEDFKSRDYSKMMKPEHWALNPGREFLNGKIICKILVTFDSHQQQDILKFANYVKEFKSLIGVQTQKNFFDVGEPSSKAKALESIVAKYNIDLNRTVSFGDANNDAPTFEVTALSCAPLNSMENALNGATFVSNKTSNEDWIADFISKYLQK
ncbi:Cof-type HAD-IIB family hydrolase [Mycoplasma zalophidermidis]|uniref:HAD family hydrolase n=1 Tax=Mycoplasma zalophidermidis TaxID=398174 RepID=A0ABS6DS15_9MOLU|nr:Cof-type HAD-IIB family hydrolase [Mycoplasma zalophidermidis]MBU4689897.1 HAD family hydrolase [Mycoplasma zalophidermidis]MBU4693812.1 HAD family hydrolase [Mycoplasma zalophidermidis]MCR8966818.1 HAD family hydrolase [Mycoplasma zalophidermidis]